MGSDDQCDTLNRLISVIDRTTINVARFSCFVSFVCELMLSIKNTWRFKHALKAIESIKATRWFAPPSIDYER